jgi:hypothetical protein
MAHFAKIGMNGIVMSVHAVNDSDTLNPNDQKEDETIGQQFLERIHGWPGPMWKQTSYNTSAGVHKLGGTPLRANYAGIGMIYDEDKDLFRSKQPYASWTLNTTTGEWEPPAPMPSTKTDEVVDRYDWNESAQSWDKIVA